MVDLGEIQAAYYMVAATGVLVAAAYYIVTLKGNNKTRQAQLLMQIYSRIQEREFMESWNKTMDKDWRDVIDSWKQGGAQTPFQNVDWLSVAMYFEGIGVLVRNKMIDGNLIYELMPTRASSYWAKFEPLFKLVREKMNAPQMGQNSEYLASEMRRLAQRRSEPLATSYAMNKVTGA